MKDLKNRIVCLAFLFILFLPLYGSVVQVVNALGPIGLVDSFALESGRNGDFSGVLQIGDTLVVTAESKLASEYTLEIYENFSVVFVEHGEFGGERMEAEVLLSPTIFSAGYTYIATFRVIAYNKLIPGTYFTDSVASAFTVVSVDTNLGLTANYDSLFSSLNLNVNLTTVDGYPVTNETVDFLLRFHKGKPTEGWVPLGSAKTDMSGAGELSLAFALPNGHYFIKALHPRNENFGASENITEIEIFSNATTESFRFALGSEIYFANTFGSSSLSNLTLEASSYSPYALLPFSVEVRYSVNASMGDLAVIFFLDYINVTGYTALNGGSLAIAHLSVGPPYIYEASLIWNPSVIRSHEIIAAITNYDILNISRVINYGTDIIASGEVNLNIQRCPSNIILDYPDALSGDVLPITVGVSKPRPYQAISAEFYSAVTLAPRFTYNGAEYVIDEGVNSTLVNLFVNGTLTSTNQTDESGLVHFQLGLDLSQLSFTLNLTVVVDGSSFLYGNALERIVTFTRVSVSDVPSAGSSPFNLTYTVNGLAGDGELYVGVENPLKAEASLFDQPVWNVSVSILSAKLVLRLKAKMFGSASYIPSGPDYGSDYMRVVFFYNHTAVAADINDDGKVDIIDLAIVSNAFGSYPGHPRWNPDADLNGDYIVDIRDLGIAGSNFGMTNVYDFYYPPQGVYLVFDSGQTVYVDSQGCARIPVGAASFTVWKDGQVVGAFIEFFRITSDTTSWTNDLGRVAETWVPSEVGTYLVQVKLLSTFSVVLSSFSSVSSVEAPLNLVGYFEVIKRQIELSVDYLPSNATFDDDITMVANVFDTGLGIPAVGSIVEFYLFDLFNGTEIYMGSSHVNSSGSATFMWSPTEYLSLYPYLSAYFVLIVKVPETGGTLENWARVVVDTRYPTSLELLSSEVVNVAAGVLYRESIVVRLVDFNGVPVPNKKVILYENGVQSSWVNTNGSGIAYWDSYYESEEIHYYTAVFVGDIFDWYHKRSNEVRIAVNVALTPVSVLFDVEPKEFKPGTELTLSASVLNTTSGEPLESFHVTFYRVMADGSQHYLGEGYTNSSGWAVLTQYYSLSLGVYSFLVDVSNVKVVVVSPTMLKVANSSYLHLGLGRTEGSAHNYVLSGMLLSFVGVPDKPVKVFVNDTLAGTATTYGYFGEFNMSLNLPPLDNRPTLYNIKAVFEGDDPQNVTSYLYTPNGTRYAVCTTVHYGYEPAVNYAAVTVEPTAAQITAASNVTATEDGVEIAPPKTPQQMQKEAEQAGWLQIWHEFTWWYPWYRLHIKVNINPTIHIGFNPLLPGGEVFDWSGLDLFNAITEEVLVDITLDFVGLFLSYVTAKGFALWNLAGGLLAEAVKGIAQYVLLYLDWNNSMKMLAQAIASFLMGLIAIGTNTAQAFLKALFNIVYGPALSALYLISNKIIVAAQPIQAFRTLLDWVEVGLDFSVGGLALLRCLGRV